MKPGRFFWKLFLGNATLLALTLGISIWLIVAEFDRFQADQLTPYLHNYSDTIVALVEHRLDVKSEGELRELVRRIGSPELDAVRITLVAADGKVLADSQGNATTMENHSQRPEIVQAMKSGRGEIERWSDTVSRTMKYVAVRVVDGGVPVGVVRVAMPVRTLAERTKAARRLLGPIGLIGLLSAIGMAVGLALLWSNRIRRLTAAAQSLSRGDLDASIPVSGSDEVAILAKSLERMRTRLARQVATIMRQRVTLESLVAQLDEGVIVAGADGRVVLVNPAAARLLGFSGAATGGIILDALHKVENVVAPHDLQRMLLRDERESDGRPEGGLTVRDVPENLHLHAIRVDIPDSPSPTYVLARACNIPIAMPSARLASASESSDSGRLLVLTDVTALMRAIRSRSDFVANASHELRTPVAAIRVAVETLTKVDFAREGEAALRFANIIARQASRLEALVTDLLDLAKVESPGTRIEPSKIFLQRAIDELHTRWEQELGEKGLRWTAEIAVEASEVQANGHLLSLVLDNLVDNAIKFTPSGGQIAARTRPSGDRILIEISDTGCGIAPNDQQRVFERFYQVDAVRTGTGSDKRGTGLGLSIVRHAVSAMGGTVRLTSEMGVGTRVIVELPRSA